ncbi:MAG: nucleotide sugar dehydrogenase [Pseudomonadota bacterium]|nr:nucleotide sugar dehydrogenase [Pseudomonadota bacterium]MEC7465031.1 nucleotide sugar dehydrogenase [Pseudomonadota bacterium]MEC7786970.1 nucleotide sugar dehydrogenase [Pseudomonadota bacterium]MEC8107877.1 nucleotide sugar dehydrogenase [Pseudomonadota bacterium]MEC8168937.1 nucleotide sugar dehydrogenase [Pseudomonadota bacterium]|tara:strand:- start:1274 stop:2572 length:1299 start_codon:yes stop_codon:yes gene_type:complete
MKKKVKKEISVIGLGYVGLPLAIEFGKKNKVVGFDLNKIRIKELRRGKDSTKECTKRQIVSSKYLSFTYELDEIKSSNVYIVTVPTPVDDSNQPDLSFLKNATFLVGSILKKNDLVIFESTVYPGATEEICIPILEKESGLKGGIDFFFGYSPERTNPGDKINTLTNIKKITSGCDIKTAKTINDLYKSIIKAGTWEASSIKVAEAAKVIENSQRDLNIAFINELSLIFDLLNIDTIEVLEAAGSKWNFMDFRPGLVGGHCIGVDPYYLTFKAEQLGYQPQVILSGRRINDDMAKITAKKIIKKMVKNEINISKATIAIFGVTFKDNCPDIRNSKIFDLIEEIENWGIKVKLIDPWADKKEIKLKHNRKLSTSFADLKVDSIVVAVGHDQFKRISAKKLRTLCRSKNPVIGDLKSIYSKEKLKEEGFSVIRL